MKKIKAPLILLALIVLVILYAVATQKKNVNTIADTTGGDRAIALIKEKYPTYQDYPSDNLPPKRIEVIETTDGWRIGMYVEGSGLPGILRANCFLVTKSGNVTEVGLFQGEGPAKSINLITCVPKE